MAIDRADWHWDSTEKHYRETRGVTGELTDAQQAEIWLLAGNHIGLFLRWIIENGFEGDAAEEADCEKVRSGAMTGTEYLLEDCDGKLWDDDIRDDILPFVESYYGSNGYYDDYAACCTHEEDKPIFGVISGEEDYAKLRVRMDAAFERFQNGSSE